MNKVVIIGGGPAGMMAGIAAAETGSTVTLLEKNERLGKKLYITGKGRCNLTNDCDTLDFFENVYKNPKFLYSAVYGFDKDMVKYFFEENGVPLKVERGNRVFPQSDKANDIITALEKKLKNLDVNIKLNTEVAKIDANAKCVYDKRKNSFSYDKLIIATGGCSYESTGSTGDGYSFAESLGIDVIKPVPSLVPFNCSDEWIKDLQGLSLKNVSLSAYSGNKCLYDGFGEMLFTHFGISGPLVLTASSVLCEKVKAGQKIDLFIDLKPSLDFETLDKRLLRDFEENKNKNFENALGGLFPSKLIGVMVALSKIDPYKKVNSVTKEERQCFLELIKKLPLHLTSLRGFNEAIITRGGICVKELDASSMQTKKYEDIYFAGEVIDVDATTGGFNLQIAFSTGHLAGLSAAE